MFGLRPPSDPEELRSLVRRLARLVEISVTLNSTLDLDRLLQFIIDSAAELVGSEAASILLVDEKTHELAFAAATGADPQELSHIPVPLDGSIAGTIFREAQPLIIDDASQDPRHFRGVGEKVDFETRSLVGVPMRIRERVTGVLEAVNKVEGTFEEADVQLLSIIASQAAVAIHNARLVEELQSAYGELGKLDKLKSDFIAIASHELRTPLGIILGYASLLRDEGGDETSEYASVVVNSALRMRTLIEDMTNMKLLQQGTAEVSLEVCSLETIAQAAYDESKPLIATKGQSFMLELPPEPVYARADASRLTMALTNLLNNATRFTPPDGHIVLALERHGEEAWLRVVDDGPGLPSGSQDRIFDAFYQAEDPMTRRYPGLGLGLAIVRAVVEAHGGRVWAENESREPGAAFTIALPVLEEEGSPP